MSSTYKNPSVLLRYLALLIFFAGCADRVERPPAGPLSTCFYHWESELRPDSTARRLLADFACDRLYVKVFDLSWGNDDLRTSAWLTVGDTAGLPGLIPVVFVTQEVLTNLPQDRLPRLAADVFRLTDKLLGAPYLELQIDCDWTARTRVPYFALLQALQSHRPDVEVTCTVRLHQYRDREDQGIPPVGRAALMAYNTGDLSNWATENSILDTSLVKGYLAGQPPYPVPLDLAVAVYDWAAVYRRDKLAYLINEPPLGELADTSRFQALEANRFRVVTSTYLSGIYLYRGDLIRCEKIPAGSLKDQTALLQRYVGGFPGQRRLIFRLGSRQWRGQE